MADFFLKLSKEIDRINEWVGRTSSWISGILVILVCIDVLSRYLFSETAAWVMELEWHLFSLLFLFGAGFALKHDRHVRVDLFYDKFSPKDKALVNQGMRIAATERELQMIQEENSTLKAELNAIKAEADETKAMLEQANESQIAAASEVARSNTPRPKAPNGGYGLHLASYLHTESIEPGLKNLEAKIPVLIEGKPIKIAKATVKGQNYNRLIVGKFDNREDAQGECRQALLLISFCEVVAFEGEDY